MNKILEIYTDGSCLVNPGGKGGYGAVLLCDPIIEISGHIQEPTTNNRAEIQAAIYAVMRARALGYHNLKIYTDSIYIVKTYTGEYRKKKNLDLWDLLDLALEDAEFEFEWVRGHSTNKYNNMADKLASKGANKY